MRHLKDLKVGVRLGEETFNCLLYADDMVLMAEREEDLQRLVNAMHERCLQVGLSVNADKTKVLVFEREEQMKICNISLNGVLLEQVSEFVYLGSMFERKGSLDCEVERRVSASARIVGCTGKWLRKKVWHKDISMAIYNGMIKPTLLYGAETGVWLNKHKRRVTAAEMRYLRSVCGVTLLDKVRNEEVQRRCGVNVNTVEGARRSCLRWFGHVERMASDEVCKKVYVNSVEGRRPRGRPAQKWSQYVGECLKAKGVMSQKVRRQCVRRPMTVEEAKEVCKDRVLWRSIVKS